MEKKLTSQERANNDLIDFFVRYLQAIAASKTTKRNTLLLLKRLIRYDPLDKTQFELSFKINKNSILRSARFLNIDANVYSCKSTLSYLARLRLFKEIMGEKVKRPLASKALKALEAAQNNPMDLYFGVDIDSNNYLFAFWLVFGGIKRSGTASFWNYDFSGIIDKLLFNLGFKKPTSLRERILNFGIDISNKLFYKLYFLLDNKNDYPANFQRIIKDIDTELCNFKYFYFYSQMYNKEGQCIKEKLFIEFLEDILPSTDKMNELLRKIIFLTDVNVRYEMLHEVINRIYGRISLISFEQSKVATFYLRPINVKK